MEQRLQKLLASAGIASRRASEELIARGKVTINGVTVTALGIKADPERDDIRVNGKPIPRDVERVYILLNKPTGFVTTVKDPHAERTVMSLVKGVGARVYPVGRLDADSAGLLILTNDGELTKLLTHPSHQAAKTYRAVVRGRVLPKTVRALAEGVPLEDGVTAPAEVELVDYDSENNASILDITLREGRNRQIRRMGLAVHHPVLALTRIRIGSIYLRGLPPGKWRKLHPAEVNQLRALAQAASSSDNRLRKPPGPQVEPKKVRKPSLPPSKPSRRADSPPSASTPAREAAAEITRRLRESEFKKDRKALKGNKQLPRRRPRAS